VVRRRRTGCELHDVASYAARWAEIAWRLCVVIHAAEHGTDAPKHSLSEASANAAVTLMKWFAREQLSILSEGLLERKTERVEKVVQVLSKSPGERLSLREMERRHNFKPTEVEALAATFPERLKIEIEKPSGPGRPSKVACIPYT